MAYIPQIKWNEMTKRNAKGTERKTSDCFHSPKKHKGKKRRNFSEWDRKDGHKINNDWATTEKKSYIIFDFTDRTPIKTKQQQKNIEHQMILPKFQQNGKIDFDFDSKHFWYSFLF